MASIYRNMTGVLVLQSVTPVITALFGAYKLDASHPGNGEAYIAELEPGVSISWDSVLDHLEKVVTELNLPLASSSVASHLYALAAHINVQVIPELRALINQIGFEDTPDLDDLFAIARLIDDGHGLRAIKTMASCHSNKPLLFEFCGDGDYVGVHVATSVWTHQAMDLGEKLDAAIEAGDTDKAADVLRKKVDDILAGVHSETVRAELRAKLGELLAAPKAVPDAAATAQAQFVDQVASLKIWSYDKYDGTAYAECEEPADGFLDSHTCLMDLIEQARQIGK